MSWSVSYSSMKEFLDDAPSYTSIPQIQDPQTASAAKEQLAQARLAAKALVDSGVSGDPAVCDFAISAYGHANPGHVPTQGWANDTVTVSVGQKAQSTT